MTLHSDMMPDQPGYDSGSIPETYTSGSGYDYSSTAPEGTRDLTQSTNLVELKTVYDQTARLPVEKVLEEIYDKPLFEIVSGVVMTELTLNLAEEFLSANPKELFFDPEDSAPFPTPRIIITEVIPDSDAGRVGSVEAGALVHRINGQSITDYASLCNATLTSNPMWTLETASSILVLNTTDVNASIASGSPDVPPSTACVAIQSGDPLKVAPKLVGSQYAQSHLTRQKRLYEWARKKEEADKNVAAQSKKIIQAVEGKKGQPPVLPHL